MEPAVELGRHSSLSKAIIESSDEEDFAEQDPSDSLSEGSKEQEKQQRKHKSTAVIESDDEDV